jgi:hypothetical protein
VFLKIEGFLTKSESNGQKLSEVKDRKAVIHPFSIT